MKVKRILTMLIVIIMALLSTYAVSDSGTEEKMVGEAIKAFPSPGPNPQGLAWDGKNLWVVDDETNKIYQLDPAEGKITLELSIPPVLGLADVDLGGLTWDGSHLLVSDDTAKRVYRVDPKERSAKLLIDLLKAKRDKGIRSIAMRTSLLTGLAWDGTYLWATFIAGYSSSVYEIDLTTDTLVTHFWAPGPEPQGLTWDGKYLWIVDSRDQGSIWQFSPIGEWTGISFPSPAGSPTDLAFDGVYLWNVDKETHMIYQIKIARK